MTDKQQVYLAMALLALFDIVLAVACLMGEI